MSAARYELWASGILRASYRTLGQALLGALWRSRKLEKYVYVHKANSLSTSSRCVATVTQDDDFAKF
jgi:hypothetical protein